MALGRLTVDALLVVGFGVQHSLLATVRVKTYISKRLSLTPLQWRGVQSMVNVVYVLAAFALWQSVNTQIWNVTGPARIAMITICVASWLWYFQLHIFEYDPGQAFGSSAAASRITMRKAPSLELWKVGSRNWIRFPVHTAFFPMFLAFPHMIASTLLFGIAINIYNVVGSKFYDQRLKKLGRPYHEYQAVTGLILPKMSSPRGATDLPMKGPRHWMHPERYTLSLLVGIGAGVLYYAALGRSAGNFPTLVLGGGVGVGVALMSGVLLGTLSRGRLIRSEESLSYDEMHARLATSAALGSAIALIVWYAITYYSHHAIPAIGLVLPLWVIVLWLGHVSMYLTGYRHFDEEAPQMSSGIGETTSGSSAAVSRLEARHAKGF